MRRVVFLAIMVAGVEASFLLSILAFAITFQVLLMTLGPLLMGRPSQGGYILMAVGFVSAAVTFLYGVRASWRLACGRMQLAQQDRPHFKATVPFAAAGALSAGGLMLAGTLLLGHMRPAWMELSYVPKYTVAGLLLGAVLGLVIDLV